MFESLSNTDLNLGADVVSSRLKEIWAPQSLVKMKWPLVTPEHKHLTLGSDSGGVDSRRYQDYQRRPELAKARSQYKHCRLHHALTSPASGAVLGGPHLDDA